MENRIFRTIGAGIAATLLLLFVLPAILRLLVVAAVVSFIYRIAKKRYLYKRAAYFYQQNQPAANHTLPQYGNSYRHSYNPAFEQNVTENPVVIKIG
ncbi:hypothetical protein C7N43_05960 [Sphingobacteriales bacterium UPWRP_1]|nr:hypothetical protein BVG80_05730 [Sphingobacteriales bacterium TSM_CSM]PSJ78000.1 hypothetical protein C7N43_05960 [Sphingobacteriales bacterium UPWRP_1]